MRHTVTIPLGLALEIRDLLLKAEEERRLLAQLRLAGTDAARRGVDSKTAIRQLREILGDATETAKPAVPRRGDTVPGMPALREDE